MTKSLQDIKAQIAELQRQADELVQAQKTAVIEDMKVKIADFGITAAELGFVSTSSAGRKKSSSGEAKPKAPVAYKNEEGLTWSGGRGPKPKWVKEILDAGGDIEKYRI